MRTGEMMIDKSKASSEIDRMEALLHQAASFEPIEPMPSTISNRLRSKHVSQRKRAPLWLAPAGIAAFSVCAASIALLALIGNRPPHIPIPAPDSRIALASPDFRP